MQFLKDPLLIGNAQVAIVPQIDEEGGVEAVSQRWYPEDMHIDGVDEVTGEIRNFSLLVGIPLDPTIETFTGNFGVIPGSHVSLQEGLRKEGVEALCTGTPEWKRELQRMVVTDSSTFEPLRVCVGQAYLAHYQTTHFIQPNVRGCKRRRVLYFRIWNKRNGEFQQGNRAALTDVFSEFFPTPEEQAERTKRIHEKGIERVVMRLHEYSHVDMAATAKGKQMVN